MAICYDCKKEMMGVRECTRKHIMINGKEYLRNVTYYDVNKRCHDCGIMNRKGNNHHLGCDIERCPKCKGQLISCDCNTGD